MAATSNSSNMGYIKRLLNTYVASADRSLSGPDRATRAVSGISKTDSPALTVAGSINSALHSTKTPSKPAESSPVVFRVPVFLLRDTGAGSHRKSETIVRGKTVACFDIGGEKRICVPDLMNTVLSEVSIDEINTACDDLCINCSQCTDEQMVALKTARVLPASTASAGLMTKSQVERLCRYLLEKKYGAGPPGLSAHRLEASFSSATVAFKVYHECFGKCKGIFYTERYVQPDSECIECCHCACLMSPADFVCHGHKGQELLTCHWGFDSTKWRSYLLLARDHKEHFGLLQARLEEVKHRFRAIEFGGRGGPSTPLTLTLNLKRKDTAPAVTVSNSNTNINSVTVSAAAKRLRLDSTSSTISSSDGADVLNLLQQQKQHFVGQVTTTAKPIGQEQPIKLKDIIESSKLKKVDGGVQESKSKVTSSQDDRRHLANMLHIATSGDSVPASTRRSLAEHIMALFDQRNATIAHLMQENDRLASKARERSNLEARCIQALADLEGAEGLAALSSPLPSAAVAHPPLTFTFPTLVAMTTPDEAAATC